MAPRSLLRQLDLYRVQLGHLRCRQVYTRARRTVGARVGAMWPARPPVAGPFVPLAPRPLAMEIAQAPAAAAEVLRGTFRFLNMPAVAMQPVDWSAAPGGSLLWSFNLHYFHHGVALAQAWLATSDEAYAARAAELVAGWIADNPAPRGAGWHPYPVALRLQAWCLMLAALQDVPAFAPVAPLAVASMRQQAAHLYRNREYDLRGNHLLADLQALAWCRRLLGSNLPPDLAEALAGCEREFWTECISQTKADGSHEENAASYQMVVLQGMFETAVVWERAGWYVPADVRARIAAMFDFLATMILPDGRIPMVNDTIQGYPLAARDLLAAGAAWLGRADWAHVAGGADLAYVRWTLGEAGLDVLRALPPGPPAATSFGHQDAGYYVIRGGWGPHDDFLLFDAGPLGPRHLMGHAHADTLGVVIYAQGRPLVVDPGVYTYIAGPWRDHFRSTAAHNTVTVDGADQSEVWAAFRVARFARATLEAWEPGRRVAASHDGYHRLAGRPSHRREVLYQGPGAWRIVDRLTAEGGIHTYMLTFQLPPGARARLDGESAINVTLADGLAVAFRFTADATLRPAIEAGWVSYAWTELLEAPAIKVRLASDARLVELTTEIWVCKRPA